MKFSTQLIVSLTSLALAGPIGKDSRVEFDMVPRSVSESWYPGQHVTFKYRWNRSPVETEKIQFALDTALYKKRILAGVIVNGPDADGWYTVQAIVPIDTPSSLEWDLKIEGITGIDKAETDDVPVIRIANLKQ